jgi:hypothetical protein
VNPDQPEPPRRRRRLTIEMFAMILLAVMILTPALIVLIISGRCVIWFRTDLCEHSWGFMQFLADTIPVLVAIIMRGGMSRPPPDE